MAEQRSPKPKVGSSILSTGAISGMNMNCKVCSKTLLRDQKIYCSKSCAAKSNNIGVDRHKLSREPGAQNKKVKECAVCGKLTTNIKHCSLGCRNSSYIKIKDDSERASIKKKMHNEAWHRYMAKRRGQTPSDVDRMELKKIYLSCPDGYEVDHIIPISRGGRHEPSNLQYLPRSENRRKHAKTQEEFEKSSKIGLPAADIASTAKNVS